MKNSEKVSPKNLKQLTKLISMFNTSSLLILSIINSGSFAIKKCHSNNIHRNQNRQTRNVDEIKQINVKKLTLKLLSLALDFSAKETLSNCFCMNLKA